MRQSQELTKQIFYPYTMKHMNTIVHILVYRVRLLVQCPFHVHALVGQNIQNTEAFFFNHTPNTLCFSSHYSQY